ncbi:MAG: hypothetical protein PUB18_01465 [bacterium]|nr:hypothetical protein [bacterium]
MKNHIILIMGLIIIFIILIIFLILGNKDKYKVNTDRERFKNVKESYKKGSKVKIYYDTIATDTDYTFYLDDEVLGMKYDDKYGYVIEFTMPNHDVTLRVIAKNTMEKEFSNEE